MLSQILKMMMRQNVLYFYRRKKELQASHLIMIIYNQKSLLIFQKMISVYTNSSNILLMMILILSKIYLWIPLSKINLISTYCTKIIICKNLQVKYQIKIQTLNKQLLSILISTISAECSLQKRKLRSQLIIMISLQQME